MYRLLVGEGLLSVLAAAGIHNESISSSTCSRSFIHVHVLTLTQEEIPFQDPLTPYAYTTVVWIQVAQDCYTKAINAQPGHFHIHLELMMSLTKRDKLCRYRSCCP